MHQAHQLGLPPKREVDLGVLLLTLQLAAQAAQIMQGLLRGWWRRVAAPQIGPVDFGGDGFKHRRQLGRIELIEVAAHQRQSQPQLVVAAEGGHGAAHFGRLQAISSRQSTEKAQHLNQGQEGIPVAIRAEVQQLLALLDLQLQLLHAAAVLLELAAVAPAVGRMQLQAFLQLMHLLGLVLHLTGQVVLGRGHVVATGHVGNGKGQATAGLIAVAQLAKLAQLGGIHLAHLQATELGMETHHPVAGQQQPKVLVGEALEQRKLPRPFHLLHNHRRRYPAA